MARQWTTVLLSGVLSFAPFARPQATSSIVDPLLRQHLQSPALVADQLRHLMLERVPPLVVPPSAADWTAEEDRIRRSELSVIYGGWPKDWIEAPPQFEQAGIIEGDGYRIVKLRYVIVPGFWSTALLYEPAHAAGKLPAIIDVNGHGDGGKAVEQKQKRCIYQARHGILALSLEFIGYGDLNSDVQKNFADDHDYIGLLEMTGKNGMGLFYLAMKRGVDYLETLPNVDRARIGVTGLSGGGWQSLVLGSLDTRIGPAAAVAGFSSLTTSIEHPEYHDAEQNAADVREKVDYAQLDAARAPRPTLLIYNAMDDCCFRADIVKQGVYSDIAPFYALYGKPGNLAWYMNADPGTHNYGFDSRQVAYRFFNTAFHLPATPPEDAEVSREVRDAHDLLVGVPKDNLTILSLAQSFARGIHHEVPPDHGAAWIAQQRQVLTGVARYTPVTLTHAWTIRATHQKSVRSMAYRFEFSNGLSATGVLFRSVHTPPNAPATIVISDKGMSSAMIEATNEIDRGRRVLVMDPLFFGQSTPEGNGNGNAKQFEQLLNAIGFRALGLEAAQVNAAARWLSLELDHGSPTPGTAAANRSPAIQPVGIVTRGPRSQTVVAVAVALEPRLFTRFDAQKSIPSLMYAFTHPLTYSEAPELMCLGLYRDFDFNTLAPMAVPVKMNLNAQEPLAIFWAH